jgi:predicted ribosomally synthesized peptide with SipW-like signal peptide
MNSATTAPSAGRGRLSKLRRKVLGSMVALGLVGLVAGVGTWSAFTATTANSGNTFAAGTVAIGDNDSGGAMFSMSGLTPGNSDSGCIQVTYTGSLASNVTMYGTTTGTGLDPYINLVVTRGTVSSGGFDSCTNFSADGTNYIGAGAGVVYSGTLQGYADSFAAGLLDAPTATESWTNGETHAYRFDVSLADNDAAQGKNATQVFTWEARNT